MFQISSRDPQPGLWLTCGIGNRWAKLEEFLLSNCLPKIMCRKCPATRPNGCTRAAIRVKYMIHDHANGFAL
jgi:hypothetical protein